MKSNLSIKNILKRGTLSAMSLGIATSFVLMPMAMPATSVYASFPTANNSNVSITAQAGIVMDFDTGEILYAKNEKQLLDPASISKIMTNYIVFEEIEAGNLSYDTVITIGSYAASIYASVPLTAGDKVTLKNLIEIMLVPSSSGSCIAIAEHISGSEAAFVQRMNETAQRLGMDAVYKQSHGSPNFPVNSVSVESQAILIRDFITRFPEVLNVTSLRSTTYKGRTYTSTNLFYGSIPYAGIDGFKTGTTSNAGYCFSGTINKDGRRLISVVLKASSGTNRYYDTKKILEHSYSLINQYSTIYDGIGTSPFRTDVEKFYATGFSSYEKGTHYPVDEKVKRSELIAVLDRIAEHYDIYKKTLINIDYENDYSMTCENVYDIINQYIPIKNDANLTIKSDEVTAFNHGVLAKTVLELVDYIEANPELLVTNSQILEEVITFDEPQTIHLPFEFNAYNIADIYSPVIATFNDIDVEVVSVTNNNFWNVNINGQNMWINTNGNMYYSANHKALYSQGAFSALNVITPQFIVIEEDITGKDYVDIDSWLGLVKIETTLLK